MPDAIILEIYYVYAMMRIDLSGVANLALVNTEKASGLDYFASHKRPTQFWLKHQLQIIEDETSKLWVKLLPVFINRERLFLEQMEIQVSLS